MTLTASVSDQPGWLITPLGRFAVRPGETLLATLLRTGHVVEYQCRSGYCGACRQRVSAQQRQALTMIATPLACLAGDEILACCCRITASLALDPTASSPAISLNGCPTLASE